MAGLLLLLASLVCALDARGQEAAQLSGRITTPDEGVVAGARVQVTSAASTAEATTNSTGHYRVRVPGGSGSFVVSVEAPGLQPATRVVTVPGAGRIDFVLARAPVVLPGLRVHVPRLSAAPGRWTPGSADVSRAGAELRRRPMEADDAADLAEASGGAQSAGPNGVGISMAGQPTDQTRLTLDGASLEGTVLPREAVGSTAVVTNTYDVARGQFTGGNVDVRTQAAGNEWGATVRFEGRHPWLQYGDASGALRQRGAHASVDAGGGGALVRDRLFAYGAFTVRQTTSPRRALEDLDPGALRGLGVSPDSVARFFGLTEGLLPGAAGADDRNESALGSGLLRLDAALSPLHSLMLRLTGQASHASSFASPLSVAGTGTGSDGTGYGVLAQLGSGGARLANDLKVQLSRSTQDGSSSDPTAAGIVRVASESGEGGSEVATLRFAGSPQRVRDTDQRAFEITDNFLLTTPDRNHRFRAGAELGIRELGTRSPADPGSFAYASLRDLQEGRPAQFTRSLGAAEHHAVAGRAALFLGHQWRAGVAELSYGLRAERSWHPAQRSVDPLVESAFGATPGDVPSRWRLSPRVGFSLPLSMPWDAGVRGTTIQGGIGEFVGALPLQAMGAALAETGLRDVEYLVCSGPAAPRPDWQAYRRDPGAVPAACADGAPVFASRFPRATIFASDFGAPRVWRTSLSARGAAAGALDWRLEASLLRGVLQPVAFDRNLRADAGFTNANEAGRRVYVPAAAIDPGTGVPSLLASRRFPELGIVREVTGGGRSRALQLTANMGRFFGLRGSGTVGYSFTSARETVGPLYAPAGGDAIAGDDPSGVAWAPSPYAPRHLLRSELTWRASNRVEFELVGRLASGLPFTPMVEGDVNGDGLSNDPAFVFDPDAQGPRLPETAAGMRRLLDDASTAVRSCLAAQAGRVAAPNSCSTPWTAGLDFRTAFQIGPQLPDSPYQRATVWLILRNVPSALDYLLHGRDGLQGWGQLPLVDNTLLTVQGFDPAAGAFRYGVNPRFGEPLRQSAASRLPMTLSIQVRAALGTDRAYRSFKDRMKANSEVQEALTPEALGAHLRAQLPNVPAEALARNAPARLYLSPEQAVRLQAAADSVTAGTERLVDALTRAVLEPGARYSRTGSARVRALSEQATALRRSAVEATRSVLAPGQWEKLPPALRTTRTRFAPNPPARITMPADW